MSDIHQRPISFSFAPEPLPVLSPFEQAALDLASACTPWELMERWHTAMAWLPVSMSGGVASADTVALLNILQQRAAAIPGCRAFLALLSFSWPFEDKR